MRFAVDGDIKYLSHHDMIRMFSRALTRARLPVRYTEGFNPHPRLSLPLPRPVGIASDVERLVVELTEAIADQELVHRLQPQVPAGIHIRDARMLEPADPSLPSRVAYRVDLPDVDMQRLHSAVAHLLSAESVYVDRHAGGKKLPKRVDIRPFIDRLDVGVGGMVLRFHVTGQGTARPHEVCRLLGVEHEATLNGIRRIEVEWL